MDAAGPGMINFVTGSFVLAACAAVFLPVYLVVINFFGLVEPDEIDFRRNLEICMPYLGPVVGEYSDWTPLVDRGKLFPEDLDTTDPWQFKNVLV